MKFKNLLLATISFAFIFGILKAGDNQMLIFGKIIDEKSGETVGAQFEIFGADGSRVKLKSNNNDGSYQQVIAPGQKYTVKFNDYNIIPSTNYFQTPDSGKYCEYKVDFKVKKLIENKPVYELNAFADKSTELNQESLDLIKSFEDFYFKNRSMYLIVKINANDAFWKEKKEVTEDAKPAKKVKGKQKAAPTEVSTKIEITEPNADDVKALVDKRVAAFKEKIENVKIFHKRLDVQADYTIQEINFNDANKPKEPNTVIISGPVVDKFK